MKVGACAVAAETRAVLSATFDELNKYFTISGMPVASGQYWNSIHGREVGEAAQDAGGSAGNADTGKEHDVSDEEHCLGKRDVWHSGKRSISKNKRNFIR